MYEVTASEILLESPIMAVRSDTVTMPGGHSANREIIEHFGAAAIVAINERQQVQLVRQYRHAVQRYLWELPAGIFDEAGEEPAAAAARELQEEVGLAGAHWWTLTDVVSSPGISEEVCRIFLVTDLHEVPRPAPEDEEADMTARWVDIDDAVAMVFSGELSNSIAVAGVLAAAHHMRTGTKLRPVDAPFPLRPMRLARRRSAALGAGNLKQSLPLAQANELNEMRPD
ncbi:NUDIX domain-containing protein [Corynebacterium ulceribovis]|uniref:NUDIX domain-containing protein n=1 Tax=Corynebacterium ulceribovis TaxID=487732 RepID=UPI0003780DBC|nr:NUDIX hydrolase [Corynebacterium ulceribovis]